MRNWVKFKAKLKKIHVSYNGPLNFPTRNNDSNCMTNCLKALNNKIMNILSVEDMKRQTFVEVEIIAYDKEASSSPIYPRHT